MKNILLAILFFTLCIFSANAQRHGNGYHYYRHAKPHVVVRANINVGHPYYRHYYHPYYYHPYYSYYHPYWHPIYAPIIVPPPPVISLHVHKTVVESQPAVSTPPADNADSRPYYPMADDAFGKAIATIQSQKSDDARLAVAKEVIDVNYMVSGQVKEIMSLFATDDAKLNFAEYAYEHVLDPNEYYVVNSEFVSEKAVKELSKYISDNNE